MFEGPDCIKQFNDLLISLKDSLFQNIKNANYPIDMTEKSWKDFNSSTKCYLCGQSNFCKKKNCCGYIRKGEKCSQCDGFGSKVRDHDHFIEHNNYRGAAHSHCNFLYRKSDIIIPIIAHNNFGYDFHFILQDLAKRDNIDKLSPISKSEMNFVSVEWGKYIFIDSLKFFNSSLKNLINVVANRKEKDGIWDCSKEDLSVFKVKNEAFSLLYPNVEDTTLTTRKGEIPYDYLSEETLKDTKLPPLECWKDSLYGEDLPQEELDYCQQVWDLI